MNASVYDVEKPLVNDDVLILGSIFFSSSYIHTFKMRVSLSSHRGFLGNFSLSRSSSRSEGAQKVWTRFQGGRFYPGENVYFIFFSLGEVGLLFA